MHLYQLAMFVGVTVYAGLLTGFHLQQDRELKQVRERLKRMGL